MSDLEALVGNEGAEGLAEEVAQARPLRSSIVGGTSEAGGAVGLDEEDGEETAPVNRTKAGNRTVIRKKKKKKKKKSRRNSTIMEGALPEDDLLEVKQDPLPALQEIPEAELQTRRGSAEDEIEKLASQLNIAPKEGEKDAPRTIESLKKQFDDIDL